MSSLIPLHYAWDPVEDWSWSMRPSRIFDQNFGMGVFREAEAAFNELERAASREFDRMPPYFRAPYFRQPIGGAAATGMSEVKSDREKFQVNLDVRHFNPQELQVRMENGYVVIEGKHEEKKDEHGFVSRQFSRKYLVPKEVDLNTFSSMLSQEGILTIEAQKLFEPEKAPRQIPIETKKAIEQEKKK